MPNSRKKWTKTAEFRAISGWHSKCFSPRVSRGIAGAILETPLSRERRHAETDRDRTDGSAGAWPRGLFQDPPPDGGPPPKAKAKAKEKAKKGAPGDELRKTYDLLRRVRSDSGAGRTEERIGDWTERATNLYRRAIREKEQGDPRRARELGTAAHDLARAIDHARNAARLDRQDPDLPPPPDNVGPEDFGERNSRDLNRAYDRIRSAGAYGPEADSKFYLDAARDLYNAARRDIEAGRDERGGELRVRPKR